MADRLRVAGRFLARLVVVGSVTLALLFLAGKVAVQVTRPFPVPAGIPGTTWQQAIDGFVVAWAAFGAAVVAGLYVIFEFARLLSHLVDQAIERRERPTHADDGAEAVTGG